MTMTLKNKKITSKTQVLAIITTLALVAVFTSLPSVDAAHSDAGNSGFFTNANQQLCYSVSAFNYMKYEGSTFQGTAVKTQIRYGESAVSTNTDMNLSETTSCSGYQSWVSSTYISDANKSAQTSYMYTSEGNQYKYIEFNYHSARNWKANGDCTTATTDLSNIANHEFGHYAGSGHQGGGSSHTMMGSSCDSGYSSIKSADITYINGKYLP